MSEAEELHRIISASVRDMLGVLQSLAPYPRAQRVALLPSVVRMLLTTFLEEITPSHSGLVSRATPARLLQARWLGMPYRGGGSPYVGQI